MRLIHFYVHSMYLWGKTFFTAYTHWEHMAHIDSLPGAISTVGQTQDRQEAPV